MLDVNRPYIIRAAKEEASRLSGMDYTVSQNLGRVAHLFKDSSGKPDIRDISGITAYHVTVDGKSLGTVIPESSLMPVRKHNKER